MTKTAGPELHRRVSKLTETKQTGFWGKLLALLRLCAHDKLPRVLHDEIELSLAGLNIIMKRETNPDTPHEVSVYVPRAEIRKNCHHGTACPPEGCPDCTVEILLNSITIVHSPRHPLAGESQKPPEIPPRLLNPPDGPNILGEGKKI